MASMSSNTSEEEEMMVILDQRKKKRMISNRESARRSRMRRQKHVDDLTAHAAHLRRENHQIATRIDATSRTCTSLEAENSILAAQAGELRHRLQSLAEIIAFLGGGIFADVEAPVVGLFDPVIQTVVSPLVFEY